jgi:hypothetical protein
MTLRYNSQVHFQYAFVKDIIRYQNVGKIRSGINGFHAISLHRKRIIWTMLTQFFSRNLLTAKLKSFANSIQIQDYQ